MAATIAKAVGMSKTNSKEVTRLGHEASLGEANTWRTFTCCYVRKNGSGYVKVTRDGKLIHEFSFGPEGDTDA